MNGHDEKILEILNDELHHSKELHDAMEPSLMFKDWGKGTEPPDWVTKEECQEMIDNFYTKTQS